MIEIVLEHDRGGGGVELLLPCPPVALSDRETRLRLMARQPLVLKNDRNADTRFERARELLHVSRLVRRRAVELARPADDDGGETLFS